MSDPDPSDFMTDLRHWLEALRQRKSPVRQLILQDFFLSRSSKISLKNPGSASWSRFAPKSNGLLQKSYPSKTS